MEHYVGIDVSLELSSVCVVDAKGAIIREEKVTSAPDVLVEFLQGLGLSIERVGLEAGPLSQWLHAGLTQAGFETALLETRHVKAALSAMTVKTDRKDARGIAQLLRMGWYRPVHCKSLDAREVRALLVARKLLLGKLLDVEFSIRGILRGFRLKMGAVTRRGFEARVRELCSGQTLLIGIMEAMLNARAQLQTQYGKLHKNMLSIVRADGVCRRLMSAPGVGPPHRALRGGQCRLVARDALLGAEALGDRSRQATRDKASEGRLGAQDRHRTSPNVGRRNHLPVGETDH